MTQINLSPHRFWLACLVCSLCLLVAAPIGGKIWRSGLEETIGQRTERLSLLSSQIKQWEADAKEARTLSDAMKGESVETYLAPMDRTALAAQLEPLAARARLTGLSYTLGPEQKADSDPAFPNMEGLSQSRLTLEADAALDADVLSFLEDLSSLPGRLTLEKLSLKRKEGELGTRNLRLHAEFLWLANASRMEATR